MIEVSLHRGEYRDSIDEWAAWLPANEIAREILDDRTGRAVFNVSSHFAMTHFAIWQDGVLMLAKWEPVLLRKGGTVAVDWDEQFEVVL